MTSLRAVYIGDIPFLFALAKIVVTVTKIKQVRTNQDRTKIGTFFDFFVYFPIFLLEILNIATKMGCEAMQKNSSKNIGKCNRKSKKGSILIREVQDWSFLRFFHTFFNIFT